MDPAIPVRDYTAFYATAPVPTAAQMQAVQAVVGIENQQQPNTILAALSASLAARLVVLVMGDDGLSYTLHRVRAYHPRIDQPGAPWANRTFAFFQELTMYGPTVVEVPANVLHRTVAQVQVLTVAAIDEVLAAEAPAEADFQLGPYGAADPNVEAVRSRQCAVIPPQYAHLVLTRRLTARQLWTELVGAIRNAGHEVVLAPVIDWVRMALTDHNNNGPAVTQPVPQPIIVDQLLGEDRDAILRADLPDRAGQGGALGTAQPLAAIQQEIGGLRADQQARDQAKVARDEGAEAPSARWKSGLPLLMQICQTPEEDDLPEVWKEMASSGSKLDGLVIRRHVNRRLRELDSLTDVEPILKPQFIKQIGQLAFVSFSDQDLDTGFTPFAFALGTDEEAQQASEIAADYEAIQEGQGASLQDAIALRKKMKARLPTSSDQLRVILCQVSVVADTLFSGQHPLSQQLRAFAKKAGNMGARFSRMFATDKTFGGSLLYAVHLELHLWFKDQANTAEPLPAPDLLTILNQIRRYVWVPPPLPAAYLEAPRAISHPHEAATTTTATSTVSSLTTGSEPGPSQVQRQQVVRNMTPAAGITFKSDWAVQRFLNGKANEPRPKNNDNIEMCLSYHKRGLCNSGCSRRGDHRRHTRAETEALLQFLGSEAGQA